MRAAKRQRFPRRPPCSGRRVDAGIGPWPGPVTRRYGRATGSRCLRTIRTPMTTGSPLSGAPGTGCTWRTTSFGRVG